MDNLTKLKQITTAILIILLFIFLGFSIDKYSTLRSLFSLLGLFFLFGIVWKIIVLKKE